MDENSRNQLKQAYAYIKQRDFVAARPLISNVLRTDKENIDAWWLAVFVAENGDDKKIALDNVLRLNPGHDAARQMLVRIEQEQQKVREVLKSPPRQTTTLPVRRIRQKSGIRWSVWTLRFIGVLLLMFSAGTMVDNFFMGGKYFSTIERFLFGDPDASAWVDADSGGETSEDVNRDERIPVIKETRLDRRGDFQIDVIRKDEAHLYHFYSSSGNDLMILANFSSGRDSSIKALELWDSNGRVLAREERFADMFGDVGISEDQFDGLISPRGIQYTTRYSGEYTVAVIARDGGPAGNYTLVIDTLQNIANTDLDQFSR